MRTKCETIGLLVCGCALAMTSAVSANDWTQWRGSNRDAKASGFVAPDIWPKELSQEWKVTVGDGVATPALAGDKLYVFGRQDGNEVFRCLDATNGKELWQDKYAADGASGPARGFSGPRSSPAVADGKVVTLGVQGTLSCLDAETGKLLWRNEDYQGIVPRFNPSSSPVIVDAVCIVQLGSERDGAIVAFDLATGEERWKWDGDGPAYGSPALLEIGGTKAIITPTSENMVALNASDGKLLMEIPYSQGRYNAASPIVDGHTIIYAGPNRGMTAEKVDLQDAKLTATELWKNADNSVQFNTPTIKDGFIFGLSNMNNVFCINEEDGQTAWSSSLVSNTTTERPPEAVAQETPERQPNQGDRGRGRRGRGGGGGYGSIVDAGSVLMALTPSGQLVVFQPDDKEFKQLASYKVADGKTYAYPIPTGSGVFIKDQDSLTLWSIK